MNHFVYWLFDPQTDDLLYIGRSHEPARRKRDFERLYQRKTRAGFSNRFTHLEEAQRHELESIQRFRPAFNKKVTSSPTSLGMKRPPASAETKAKMRAAKLGTKHSAETKAKISRAGKGNKHRLGTKHSEETKAKIVASNLLTRSFKTNSLTQGVSS